MPKTHHTPTGWKPCHATKRACQYTTHDESTHSPENPHITLNTTGNPYTSQELNSYLEAIQNTTTHDNSEHIVTIPHNQHLHHVVKILNSDTIQIAHPVTRDINLPPTHSHITTKTTQYLTANQIPYTETPNGVTVKTVNDAHLKHVLTLEIAALKTWLHTTEKTQSNLEALVKKYNLPSLPF